MLPSFPHLADPNQVRPPKSLIGALVRMDTGAKVATPADESLALTTGVTYGVLVNVAGLARWRVRAKCAGAGLTLTFAYVRPTSKQHDPTTADVYATSNPTALALVAGTENNRDEDTHRGEPWLLITFPGATGTTLNFLDFMGV